MSDLTNRTKAVLMLGGVIDLPVKDIRELLARNELLVCADSGSHFALAHKLVPDAIVGDLDSITPEDLLEATAETVQIVKINEQETGDCEKSFKWLLSIGVTDVVVLGIGGGRNDHALANLNILMRFRDQFNSLIALELENEIHFHSHGSEIMIEGWPGRRISFMPFPSALAIISHGLEFPITGNLTIAERDSLSNRMLSSSAGLLFESGAMIVFLERTKREVN
jgi:thiamine pyrophosphokinase